MQVWSTVEGDPRARLVARQFGTSVKVRFSDEEWQLETRERDRPVLSFAFPETAYAVLLSWDASWRFEGYYVNIQSPLRLREGRAAVADGLAAHLPGVAMPPMPGGLAAWIDLGGPWSTYLTLAAKHLAANS